MIATTLFNGFCATATFMVAFVLGKNRRSRVDQEALPNLKSTTRNTEGISFFSLFNTAATAMLVCFFLVLIFTLIFYYFFIYIPLFGFICFPCSIYFLVLRIL